MATATLTGRQKSLAGRIQPPPFHMVGNGFRVRNYIGPGSPLSRRTSPFLLLDYLPPQMQTPTEETRGVGPHPHRGFETVSLAFAGRISHLDSAGNGGVIGSGDVQWMTAGSGVLHREYHEREFARAGGPMHFMQIWVNLPRAHKMHPPRYQALMAQDMGRAPLPDGGGEVRVIAGEYAGAKGPANTFTPVNLFDMSLNPGGRAEFSFPARENTALMVMEGEVTVNGREAKAEEFILFANTGEDIVVRADVVSGARAILLNGEPIDEPLAAYGPFVMNTEEEIHQALTDLRAGKFGHLDP
jgi:redox-sensitive bicupin YhaK (pirin superfamily)